MDNDFEFDLSYKGKEQIIPAKLITSGYSYRIAVNANDEEILFERDDANNWRAILPYGTDTSSVRINKDLISAIAARISDLFP
jgi:hypothetical protein